MVATDLSPRSDRAVDRALMLGGEWGTHVSVIHVCSKAQPDASWDWDARIRETLAEPDANVSILHPVGGSVHGTIIEAACDKGSGLLVTGVARMNEFRDYFLGSAVDQLLRHADVPLLVVKARPHGSYSRLLAATDLSKGSLDALITAARLFPGCPIDLLHAYHVPYDALLSSRQVKQDVAEEEQEDFEAFLAEADLDDALRARITMHLKTGDLDTVVAEAIDELEPDLLVLGTHGTSGFVRATIGSRAESLLKWVPLDTLLVRNAD